MNQRKYIVSFLIIALLIALNIGFTQFAIDRLSQDSKVVNISGRQRMLSQKISKVAAELSKPQETENRNALERELEEAITLFENSQEALQFGDENLGIEAKYSRKILAMYDAIEPKHKLIVNAGKSIIDEQQETESIQTILDNEQEFLFEMNKIVFAHDSESQQKIDLNKIYILISQLILLASLPLIWLLIIKKKS
jgi:nitrate/nitrite-specific signal transduction histidine kinase